MRLIGIGALALSITLSACQIVDRTTSCHTLDQDLASLTQILSGDFFSAADGGASEGRPIYLRIRNITPRTGQRHAMYAEMRHDGPDGAFYRQLIYLFDEGTERVENRMQAYRVADKQAASQLVFSPDAYADGRVEVTSSLSDDCYTVWTKTESGFSGWLDPERCIIIGKRGDQRRIESRTEISRASIGQLERGYSLDMDLLFGNATGELYVWPRVTPTKAD